MSAFINSFFEELFGIIGGIIALMFQLALFVTVMGFPLYMAWKIIYG